VGFETYCIKQLFTPFCSFPHVGEAIRLTSKGEQ